MHALLLAQREPDALPAHDRLGHEGALLAAVAVRPLPRHLDADAGRLEVLDERVHDAQRALALRPGDADVEAALPGAGGEAAEGPLLRERGAGGDDELVGPAQSLRDAHLGDRDLLLFARQWPLESPGHRDALRPRSLGQRRPRRRPAAPPTLGPVAAAGQRHREPAAGLGEGHVGDAVALREVAQRLGPDLLVEHVAVVAGELGGGSQRATPFLLVEMQARHPVIKYREDQRLRGRCQTETGGNQ